MKNLKLARPANSLLKTHAGIARFFFWGLFFAFGWLRFVRRYRIHDLAGIRRSYEQDYGQSRGPLLICATHPTPTDAVLILWALASPFRYLTVPSRYPWIVTDPSLFSVLRLLLGLGVLWKSVYVRQGAGLGKNRRTMKTLETLLARNEAVLIFPEGTRNDGHPSYLVGRLLQKFPDARLLCLGVKSDPTCNRWERPRSGTRFEISLASLQPKTQLGGAHGVWDLASQVQRELDKLKMATT